MRTKPLLAVGRPVPSGMRSSNLWSLIMAICDDAMPWLHHETQFAYECFGDLVTLEKAKLRGDIRGPDKAWNGLLKCFKK